MNEIGRRLAALRTQRGLSLRDLAERTQESATRRGDPVWRVSASWLGRIERENHSISHIKLQSIEEALGVPHGDLMDALDGEESGSVPPGYPDVPPSALNWLSHLAGSLLPPEYWTASFPETTLLPLRSQLRHVSDGDAHRHHRDREPRYGVIGGKDFTLVPIVSPGALVEIDATVRSISPERLFYSVHARPIYFLRLHDGYACGWCELDEREEWLSLVPSARAQIPHPVWRYRKDVEVIGQVIRVCGRLGFPPGFERSKENGARKAVL